jgi:hypothetical protein
VSGLTGHRGNTTFRVCGIYLDVLAIAMLDLPADALQDAFLARRQRQVDKHSTSGSQKQAGHSTVSPALISGRDNTRMIQK